MACCGWPDGATASASMRRRRRTPSRCRPDERGRRIVLLVVGILAPLAEAGLAGTFGLLGRGAPGLGGWRPGAGGAARIRRTGERRGRRRSVLLAGRRGARGAASREAVRLLAPFDPIVWERRRFEHLWGWDYRFEAYTRPEQRRFGYYAMPLLWGYDVIGWANVSADGGRLDADLGFVGARPKDPAFRRGLDAELAAMKGFLSRDSVSVGSAGFGTRPDCKPMGGRSNARYKDGTYRQTDRWADLGYGTGQAGSFQAPLRPDQWFRRRF